jgi:hypothetical protein
LPRWFPPIRLDVPRGEDVWVDAVFATDSNAAELGRLDQPVRDIWVIWTVDISGEWRNGWRANYFRMLEQAAAAAYRREREELIHRGYVPAAQAMQEMKRGCPRPHRILYEIVGDVPVHYLFTFFRRQVSRAVDQGAREATAYLDRYAELLEKAP